MKKLGILSAVAAAMALSAGGVQAEDMEKCTVVDQNGKGLIKAHTSDCKSENQSCSGHNEAGDPNAWILVPSGECAKINAGDFSGVSDTIKDKVESA